jgi:hypothetical protein
MIFAWRTNDSFSTYFDTSTPCRRRRRGSKTIATSSIHNRAQSKSPRRQRRTVGERSIARPDTDGETSEQDAGDVSLLSRTFGTLMWKTNRRTQDDSLNVLRVTKRNLHKINRLSSLTPMAAGVHDSFSLSYYSSFCIYTFRYLFSFNCAIYNINYYFAGMELRVGNKFRLGRKIGSGSFGDIYLGGST